MIKLFRKIRLTLLSVDKTGKYFKYAIGEIVLVVIGILIALQINNWNEKRKDNLTLNEYSRRIIMDFSNDTIEYQYYLKILNNRTKKIFSLKENINKNQFSIAEIRDSIINYGNLIMAYNPITTTYDDLINSGNLDLFSIKKREAILNHYRWIKFLEQTIDKNEDRRINERMSSLKYLNNSQDEIDFYNALDYKRPSSFMVQGLKHRWNEMSMESELLLFLKQNKELYFSSVRNTIVILNE